MPGPTEDLATPDPDSEEPFQSDWTPLPSDSPTLFERLRELPEAEIHLRFHLGTEQGYHVTVPAANLTLRGRLQVEPTVDRFGIRMEGWGVDDFAWFSRRKGRGRTDYWQAAIEYRPQGVPALVLYLTAPLSGLRLQVRPLERKLLP